MPEISDAGIAIEVAVALPDRQAVVALTLTKGTTAREALLLSGLQSAYAEIDFSTCALGVFGRVVADVYEVQSGDRVEVYRPLLQDPRTARRRRAAAQRKRGAEGA